MKKPINIVAILFSTIGLIELIVAFVVWQNTQKFIQSAFKAKGVVIQMISYRDTDNTLMQKPLVKFKTQKGKEVVFTGSVASTNPSYTIGEKVDVFYQPEKPQEAKLKSSLEMYFVPFMLGGMGFLFFSVGFGIFLVSWRKKNRHAYLRQRGMQVWATLREVSYQTNITINGRHPYQIVAEWQNPMNSNTVIFVSESIMFDPSAHIPDEIPVWIEHNNPDVYFMDVSFLPKEG